MRVITGTRKGTKLFTPQNFDVRPTTDSVKEAIFSTIQFELEDSTVLDIFAGTGQLGIEALSRGAKKAYFVDNNAESISIIKKNIEKTKFTESAVIHHLPNSVFLKRFDLKFDFVFMDPPYERKLVLKTLPLLVERMNPNGAIICEHEKELRLPEIVGNYRLHKTYKHGQIWFSVYRDKEDDTENE